jgi:hypothetical protein
MHAAAIHLVNHSSNDDRYMTQHQNDLISAIRRSLSESKQQEVATIFPTVLLQRPGLRKIKEKEPSADQALAYYCLNGFDGNRTRMNTFGYPGLLRDLNSPPPWVEVEPEDIDEQVSQERLRELRPLIEYAHDTSEEALVAEWKAVREEHNRMAKLFLNEEPQTPMTAFAEESFRQILILAKALGIENFTPIFEAVFDFDDFTPAAGAPDLLVWLPKIDPALWFFSEVKGPGDSLRVTQKEWLHKHWNVVAGHFLLTILD